MRNKWLLAKDIGLLEIVNPSFPTFDQAVAYCEENCFEGFIVEIKEHVSVKKQVVFTKMTEQTK